MKKLELEQMGVQEMDAVEMKKTDGGFVVALLFFVAAVAIMDGFADGQKDSEN